MKRKRTRTVFLTFLILASLSSYLYLNLSNLSADGAMDNHTETSTYEEDMKPSSQTTLPDAELLFKAIELGKRILPIS